MFVIKIECTDRAQAEQLRSIVANRLGDLLGTAANPEQLDTTRVNAGAYASTVTELLVLVDRAIDSGVKDA